MKLITGKPKFELALTVEMIVIALMAVGTVFVFSAGKTVDTQFELSEFYKFTTLKQLAFFPLAILVMYIVSRIPYRRFSFEFAANYKSITPYLFVLSVVLLVLVLIPGIGVEKNLARRWLEVELGPARVSFQPSELSKWALVLFLSAYLWRNRGKMGNFVRKFVPACSLVALVCGLIITQDFGTAALIAVLGGLVLLAGGARWYHFIVPGAAAVPAFCAAVMTSATRMNRIRAFLNPEIDLPACYQARQSLSAIRSGGLWGKGMGRGIMKYGHLPEDTTDFIFAVIAEEWGFIGSMLVILLITGLIFCGILIAWRCRDGFGKLLASAIVLTFGLQSAINIGVVTVVLPTKGMGLPFISAGGTSMLLSAAAAGVLINIARNTDKTGSELPV